VSEFVTPTVGPDQWVVATLLCLFGVYYAKQLIEWASTGNDGPE
jgi:hypothetical protein